MATTLKCLLDQNQAKIIFGPNDVRLPVPKSVPGWPGGPDLVVSYHETDYLTPWIPNPREYPGLVLSVPLSLTADGQWQSGWLSLRNPSGKLLFLVPPWPRYDFATPWPSTNGARSLARALESVSSPEIIWQLNWIWRRQATGYHKNWRWPAEVSWSNIAVLILLRQSFPDHPLTVVCSTKPGGHFRHLFDCLGVQMVREAGQDDSLPDLPTLENEPVVIANLLTHLNRPTKILQPLYKVMPPP